MVELPKRILIKLSGETLLGAQPFGIDHTACQRIAQAVKNIHLLGIEIGIVIGGGNLFRGIQVKGTGILRTPADHIGMLATLMNGVALQQTLSYIGCPSIVLSALECPKVAPTYQWALAMEKLTSKHVVIFSGGTGNPYFTTDTAAALRACEIDANFFVKATNVDGVYDKDPVKDPTAQMYRTISYSQFLAEKLKVMDATSIALCRDNKVPILVLNKKLLLEGNAEDIFSANPPGTIVKGD